MSLVGQIARKDFFRLRFILLLWAVVITGHVAFSTLQSALNPAAAVLLYVPALIFGFIFLPAFSLGLPMGVLSDDSLADSDAFWVTRPISGAQLLAAKLVVFVTLAFFPALVTAPWWLAYRYNFGQLLAAALNTAWWNASLMILSVAIASMSRSIGRFVMGMFAAAVPFLLVATFVEPVIAASHALNVAPLDGDAWPRFMAQAWALVTILVVLHQFLTRRTARSLVIAVVGVVIAFTASLYAHMPAKEPGEVHVDDPTPRLEALLSPMVGGVSHIHGITVRVVEAAMDGTRYVLVATEAASDFSYPSWMHAPRPTQPARSDSYFLVHRTDGRFVRANAVPMDIQLIAATQRHSRRALVFALPSEWQRDPTFNFNTWVKDTTLVKFAAPTDLPEPPRRLLPANLSPP